MSWAEVALAALNVFQAVALAAIAVWSQRTSSKTSELNGAVLRVVRRQRASDRPESREAPNPRSQEPF